MGPLLCLSEQGHLPDSTAVVDEGHLESDVATHLSSQNFHAYDLRDIWPLGALDSDLVVVDMGKGLVDHRLLVVCAERHVLDQTLSLLVVLGHYVLILLVINCPVLLIEEYFVFHNQNIFIDCVAFLVNFLSLDQRQIVQEYLTQIVSVLIFKQLDISLHERQQVLEVQIKRKLRAGFVFKCDHSQDVLHRCLAFLFGLSVLCKARYILLNGVLGMG